MKLSAQERMKISAELADISKEVEVDDFEESIPDELKADEEFDLELDNANPMMAENEDDIEQLELEDEEKGDKEMLADDEEVEKIQMEELDSDPVVNVADIVKAADDDGNIKLSCIKALADETVIPDDKQDDDIVGCSKKGSIEKPGVEDKIGDEANGGDPSTSKLKTLIGQLDECADWCQKNGKRQLAYRIDKVSNTLEGYLK